MYKRAMAVLVIGLFAVGFFGGGTQGEKAISPVIKKSAKPTMKYTSHASILINNDADFNSQFPNRTIWGLEINGTGHLFCIYIGNCSQAFTIKNCYLYNATYSTNFTVTGGLTLYNVVKGFISNNTICGNMKWGVALYGSSNNTITDNTLSENGTPSGSGSGIRLDGTSNYNNILHNTLINNPSDGIDLNDNYYNIISHNNITGSQSGICLVRVSNCSIEFNSLFNISYPTMFLMSVRYCILNNNNLFGNIMGMDITENCRNLTIINNYVAFFKSSGIFLDSENNCTVRNNYLHSDCGGIAISRSEKIAITNNTCSGNTFEGIDVSGNDNTVTGNNCSGNSRYGIDISGDFNTISSNRLQGNTQYGIYIEKASSQNRIYYNNFIDNNGGGKQAFDCNGTNFWNASYPYGGNYWSDWTGPDNKSGPNQDQFGGDGFVDFPYLINTTNGAKDYYPFTTELIIVPETPLSPFPLIIISVILITAITVRLRKR